jgi:hypothetical protein
MTSPTDRLLGAWRLLRATRELEFLPGLRTDFRPDGRLNYSFDLGERREVIEMRYRVEGATLRTEVPGTTHAATAVFEFGPGNVLIFHFGDASAWLIRELDVATPGGTG